MIPNIKGRKKKAGLPPGTVVYVGRKKPAKTRIRITTFDQTYSEEKETIELGKLLPLRDNKKTTWINVDGLQKTNIIEEIGKYFGLHPLVLEDVANTGQRPKMEDYTDYIFVVIKMLQYNEEDKEIKAEQVSLILGSNWVTSFQETEGDVFDPIRERLRTDKGRIRQMGADYLLYALIDAVVDNYFAVLEKVGEKIEEIEDEIVSNPSPVTLQAIHELKRQMILLRKSVWPLREVISRLERLESKLIDESTDIFLRDLYDHTIQVIDAVETFRDMLSGMLDIYMSSVSNRMNEVMKVLTIIATVFLPLTLIAGIYGMNFRFMPELEWGWGYPFALLVMLMVGLVMLFYFRRRNWL
ncbi:magnesium/cobalt transporter CorA [Candidatus Bathyarchaeota archaeon]|nr:magnesium/cobalt transporter CorA [Candidatus Bathyarchaeota archaeon]